MSSLTSPYLTLPYHSHYEICKEEIATVQESFEKEILSLRQEHQEAMSSRDEAKNSLQVLKDQLEASQRHAELLQEDANKEKLALEVIVCINGR